MEEYLSIFVDEDYPHFIDKYLNVKTLERIKYVTQFCGCDYTRLYSPRFLFTRFDHSLVVAHMTWHFTHSKKATVAALLHDVATPCFAHAIDHAMGDYLNQESSERNLADVISQDDELMSILESDGISLEEVNDLAQYTILENKSPRLCTDRLDGVLHTPYVWLNRGTREKVKRIYDDLIVLENEDGISEIGFKTMDVALEFVHMTEIYALELQGNKDKFVTEFVAQMVKKALSEGVFSIDDLYSKRESEIVEVLEQTFPAWDEFRKAEVLCSSNEEPNGFYVAIETKKRNVVPLVKTESGPCRIDVVSLQAKETYDRIRNFHDDKYACVPSIVNIEVRAKRQRLTK